LRVQIYFLFINCPKCIFIKKALATNSTIRIFE